MSTVGEQLIGLRERSGLTLDEVASAANYRGRSSVQKFFRAEYDPPFLDMVVAGRLARALVGRGTPQIEEAEVFALTSSKKNELDRYNYKEMNGLKRDVGVYFCLYVEKRPIIRNQIPLSVYVIELDTPISYMWHPPSLMDNGDIYAVRFQRMALVPRYRPGECILIDGLTPARLGDDVCIYFDELEDIDPSLGTQTGRVSSAAMVLFGTLERETPDALHLRTIDGSDTFLIRQSEVKNMHRLVNLTEAMGT